MYSFRESNSYVRFSGGTSVLSELVISWVNKLSRPEYLRVARKWNLKSSL